MRPEATKKGSPQNARLGPAHRSLGEGGREGGEYSVGQRPQSKRMLKKEIRRGETNSKAEACFGEVVARGGIEPPTQRFSVFRSTTELPGHT